MYTRTGVRVSIVLQLCHKCSNIFVAYRLLYYRYNNLLLSKNPKAAEVARSQAEKLEKLPDESDCKVIAKESLLPPPTQQFGVSLQFIIENNTGIIDSIPPVVRQCVEFLSQPDGE